MARYADTTQQMLSGQLTRDGYNVDTDRVDMTLSRANFDLDDTVHIRFLADEPVSTKKVKTPKGEPPKGKTKYRILAVLWILDTKNSWILDVHGDDVHARFSTLGDELGKQYGISVIINSSHKKLHATHEHPLTV